MDARFITLFDGGRKTCFFFRLAESETSCLDGCYFDSGVGPFLFLWILGIHRTHGLATAFKTRASHLKGRYHITVYRVLNMTSGWKNNFLEKRNKAEKVVKKFLPVVVDKSRPEDNRNAFGDLLRKSWYAEKYSTRESETNRFDEISRNSRLGVLKRRRENKKNSKEKKNIKNPH